MNTDLIDTDALTGDVLNGPMHGVDASLSRVIARGEALSTLHEEMTTLRLFGAQATQSSDDDHVLVSTMLMQRDAYLQSAVVVRELAASLLTANADILALADPEQRATARGVLDSLMREYNSAQKMMMSRVTELQDAMVSATNLVLKSTGQDLRMVIDEARRVRSELDLERKKILAGSLDRVSDSLRFSASALLAARASHGVSTALPAGALDAPDASESDADSTAHAEPAPPEPRERRESVPRAAMPDAPTVAHQTVKRKRGRPPKNLQTPAAPPWVAPAAPPGPGRLF